MSDAKLNLPVDRLLGAKRAIASGVPEGFDALLIALLSQGARGGDKRAPILHIARDSQRLTALEDALHFFAPNVKRLSLPAWDSVPYDRVAPNAEIVAERIATLANLANLESDLGQRDAALATYEKILAIDPGYHEALARYANLKAVSGPDDPLVARLRQALAAPSVAPADKTSLAFALGNVLDSCGAYDQGGRSLGSSNRFGHR